MPALSTTPVYVSAPDDKLTAVDVYENSGEKINNAAALDNVDDQLRAIEPGTGNMWYGNGDTGFIDPKDFTLAKAQQLTSSAVKDAILSNPTVKGAFGALDSAHQTALMGVNAVKSGVAAVQQTVNGVTNTINAVSAGAVGALFAFANVIYGTACNPNLFNKAATITITTNFLNIAMLLKVKGMFECIMASPLLNPSAWGEIIKNMIPKIKFAGDIDVLKSLTESTASKYVIAYAPDLTSVFLHSYAMSIELQELDYAAEYDKVITVFTELHPTWNQYKRKSGYVLDALDILGASTDFKTILETKAVSIKANMQQAESTWNTSDQTHTSKYYHALAQKYQSVNTFEELNRVFPNIIY